MPGNPKPIYEIFSINNENLLLYFTAKKDIGNEIIIVVNEAKIDTFIDVKIVEKLNTITSP